MSRAHVLAVDDEPAQLASLKRILRRSNIEVDTATNGRAGLRIALRDRPDLILVDVSMPTMSGFEFVRRLRRFESRGRRGSPDGAVEDFHLPIPIIFLTGLGAAHQRVNGLDAGAVDYITKPFEADELRARVRAHLKRAGEQKERLRAVLEERQRLLTAMETMRSFSRACAQMILDLNMDLELAGQVLGREAARDLLTRAKREVGLLTQTLLQIAEAGTTKEPGP